VYGGRERISRARPKSANFTRYVEAWDFVGGVAGGVKRLRWDGFVVCGVRTERRTFSGLMSLWKKPWA
jgi:hypothetical protein